MCMCVWGWGYRLCYRVMRRRTGARRGGENEWMSGWWRWLGTRSNLQQRGPNGNMRTKMCVCVYMSDSVVLGYLDCLPIHTPIHTRAYSFLTSPLLPVHTVYWNPAFHFLTSLSGLSLTPPPPSFTLHVSISGLTLGQSLLVGLVARFPSGHGINSRLLTLTQPDWAKANLVSFSPPASYVHITFILTPYTHKITTEPVEKVY